MERVQFMYVHTHVLALSLPTVKHSRQTSLNIMMKNTASVSTLSTANFLFHKMCTLINYMNILLDTAWLALYIMNINAALR